MNKTGTLYIVATPIGNMDDITLRAVKILAKVDVVAAEDTRHTARLLSYHNISALLISCHEYNEAERALSLVQRLESGESVAIVSDAGTPSVSDPGFRLVQAAVEKGIKVVPVPGVSAAVTALSASGLPTDSFTFIGFPQKKKGKRLTQLENLKNEPRTLIFYESPRRVLSFIEEVIKIMGDRYGVLSREMTKVHEEFIRGNLSHILEIMKERPSVKGECTILIGGMTEEKNISPKIITKEIETNLEAETSISDLSKRISKKYGIPKKEVYAEALKIQKQRKNNG